MKSLKTSAIILAVASIGLFGCEKEESPSPNNNSSHQNTNSNQSNQNSDNQTAEISLNETKISQYVAEYKAKIKQLEGASQERESTDEEILDAIEEYKLGIMYYYGRGVSEDYNKALELFTKSAYQNYANAQAYLSYCYYYGYGAEKDYDKSAAWAIISAEQGYAVAQNHLGFLYAKSNIYELAVKWFTLSAEQGFDQAQNNLGKCYYYGRGVSVNKQTAKEWLQKSADQGNETAIKFLKEHDF